MPIIRLLAVLTLLLPSLRLAADSSMALHYHGYQSSDGVRVFTPNVDINTDLTARTQLAIRYNLDAVSAASFNHAQSKTHVQGQRDPGTCWQCHASTDALSGATHHYLEQRHGVTLSITRKGEKVDLKSSYTHNTENDYQSHAGSAGVEMNLNKHTVTLSASIHGSADRIFPVINNSQETLQTLGADAGYTQVLTPLTVFNAGYAWAAFDGFQSNPYSYVQTEPTAAPGFPMAPEKARHPRRRSRHVGTASLKQGLGWSSALQLDYRYYQDDWEVQSHTLETTISKQMGSWMLEPSWRFYTQPQGAYFFKDIYNVSQPFITRDLKLAPHQSQTLGVSLSNQFNDRYHAEIAYRHYQREDSLDYSRYFGDGPASAHILQIILTVQ